MGRKIQNAQQPSRPEPLLLRLVAGRHAVKGSEVEIFVDGYRLTGGNGIVEFNLDAEAWVEIRSRGGA
jgi:hypothetical protein